MRFLALMFLIVIGVVAAAITKDGDVLVLDDTNFLEATSAHNSILVEFYAPWCGHCKSLAPEWAKAATTLAGTDEQVKLAKVDATIATGLAKEYGIKGFPTIKFFKNGKDVEYSGGRTESEIVDWVRKKTGPAYRLVSNEAELNAIVEKTEYAAVGVFSSADSSNARAFIQHSSDFAEDAAYFFTTSEEVRSALGLAHDSIVVMRTFDTPRVDFSLESGFDSKAVSNFITAESNPLITEFSQKTQKKVFGAKITKHCLIFTDPGHADNEGLLSVFRSVSGERKGELLFVNIIATTEHQRILEYFGLKESDLPTSIFVDMSPEGGNMLKFPYPGQVEATEISAFAGDFLAGNLKAHLKSEAVSPEDTAGDVVVLKGASFHDLVINNDKDVFIKFYAPWCGHCKKLAPTWDELGAKFKGTNVVIAKMDSTANEIDEKGFTVKGFPTLIFVAGNKKDAPVSYGGGRELDDLVEYVQANAFNKVTPVDHDEL